MNEIFFDRNKATVCQMYSISQMLKIDTDIFRIIFSLIFIFSFLLLFSFSLFILCCHFYLYVVSHVSWCVHNSTYKFLCTQANRQPQHIVNIITWMIFPRCQFFCWIELLVYSFGLYSFSSEYTNFIHQSVCTTQS